MSQGSIARKKILFILPSLLSGGAERVLITLMNGLTREAYERVFLSVMDKGELVDHIDGDIERYCLNRKMALTSLPALYNAIKEIQPDMVVSTMAHMNFMVLLIKPFLPKHTKFIVREAITPSFFFNKHRFLAPFLKIAYKILYPMADLVLSPSHLIFEEFKTDLRMKDKRFQHLPNPVDIQAIQGVLTKNKNLVGKSVVRFVSCGRLSHQKGFDRLICLLANNTLPYPWRLDIIGEGEEQENLQAQIDLHGLTDKIQLHGLIRNPYAHFAQADYFLLPSRFEGLPNVVLESLACGTPIIATAEAGGIQEIANHTKPDDLQIVQTMDDFQAALQNIRPAQNEKKYQNLLPELYIKQNVIHSFNGFIKNLFSA